jgi:hypothetical protein
MREATGPIRKNRLIRASAVPSGANRIGVPWRAPFLLAHVCTSPYAPTYSSVAGQVSSLRKSWKSTVQEPASLSNAALSPPQNRQFNEGWRSAGRTRSARPELTDTYTAALAQIIEAKREDKPLPEAPEPKGAARCSI